MWRHQWVPLSSSTEPSTKTQGTGTMARGTMAGRDVKSGVSYPEPGNSVLFCLILCPWCSLPSWGLVDRTMPASGVISSLAGLLREKVYSRNFVVTGGKMEKEVKRAGEGDWEVPRKCHFQFSVSLGPGWPEVRWRLFLPLLSASHANAHFLRQKQIYTHIRVK